MNAPYSPPTTDPQGGSLALASAPEGALAAQGGPAARSPRLVIRGESFHRIDGHTHPQAAFTDYLTVTFPFLDEEDRLANVFDRVAHVFCGALGSVTDQRRGIFGFKRSFAFENGNAVFAFGGNGNRAMLSLPGEACAMVPSWRALVELLRDEWQGRITRWDGARDELEGRYTVNDAVTWYCGGGFTSGGNRPDCSQKGNWLTPDTKGRTFYVGNRKNGKLCRVYEKGKQLGDPLSPWVRFEVELHNKDRFIPFDVVLYPGQYVAGAYPCFSWITDKVSRIPTISKTQLTAYEAMVRHAQRSYGPLIDTMEFVEGGAEAAIERLRRPGLPKRLDVPTIPNFEGFEP